MKTRFLLMLFVLRVVMLPAAELPGDRMLARYFEQEVAKISAQNFADIKTLEDWKQRRDGYRRELQEMLGLYPMPKRTDLHATVTGRIDHEQFYVENLYYQSMPGLYVTANIYVPKNIKGKVPAILYVCGHGPVKIKGVSYGNKVTYQHHGEWFARNGYVCLTIDTIQLGELEGIHHGTYREGMWWWNARGYTPAGVEAWNSIRALDYLQSRPEVDPDKLGMTGRSGGGAYTWWTSALDERVKVAVPVAGITDLHNHVVDGCVEGHCDCMFMVNTYRWDYSRMAALIAPRALLLGNSDKDKIFPLDGVMRVLDDVARIYKLYDATNNFGILITDGPHKDTQDLQLPAFRWFNRHLKGEDPVIEMAATKFFTPQQLKVFTALPEDERTTKIHESFVPMAHPNVPSNKAEWERQRAGWMRALKEKSFRGWPTKAEPLNVTRSFSAEADGYELAKWEFDSQGAIRLPLYAFAKGDVKKAREVRLHVLGEKEWDDFLEAVLPQYAGKLQVEQQIFPQVHGDAVKWLKLMDQAAAEKVALVFLPPRGIGPTQWNQDKKKNIQIKRRFMLVGQTLAGMQVWDICQAVNAVKSLMPGKAIHVQGTDNQAVNALYASLFVDGIASVSLQQPPASHMTGPDYLNVLRFLDIPQMVAMAAARCSVKISTDKSQAWSWAVETSSRQGWPKERLSILTAE